MIVAAPGPSLSPEVAEACRGRGHFIIAVNDAYRLLPFADLLYGADTGWWRHHKGCQSFKGEKWTCEGGENKDQAISAYHLKVIGGAKGHGFSLKPGIVNYGGNSGFQAINLALLLGARCVVLVGFDMRLVDDKMHFFGDHPGKLKKRSNYPRWIGHFNEAAKRLPAGITILNATPDSALTCFPMVSLEEALRCEHAA